MPQNPSDLAASEPIFRALIEGGGTFTLKPHGNSMRPTILPGRDTVNILRLDGRAEKHDILFYKRPNGQFVLHRVTRVRRDGGYDLCGDHQPRIERNVRPEWIIGVVTRIETPKGELLRGTRAFRASGHRRALSRPLRYLYNCAARLYHKLVGK